MTSSKIASKPKTYECNIKQNLIGDLLRNMPSWGVTVNDIICLDSIGIRNLDAQER